MNPEFALLILKEQKEILLRTDIDNYAKKHGERNMERIKTRMKHQIASLDFAIEVLETYMD